MAVNSVEEKPLVSVAMATFNGEKFLRKQLDSIFSQTYQRIEVIVCDDCSSDNTAAILEEYSRKYNLKYEINQFNLGLIKNFEKAMSLCTGRYIALADQDDIWLPEKIEILVEQIVGHSLVYSDAYLIDEQDICLPKSLVEVSGVKPVSGHNFQHFVCNSCITGCTTMVRRELLDIAIPIPACETFHDWWLSVVASCRDGVRYVDRKLIQYRQHASNVTGANIKSGLWSRILAHLRQDTQQAKMEYYQLLRDRATTYLLIREQLRLTKKDQEYLEDVAAYAASLLDRRFHLKSFLLAFKLKENLFPSAKTHEKYVFVFSKLFNKLIR